MKIFITGGTGLIGTYLVKRLARTNHELYCLVRTTSNIQNLKKSGATLVVGDLRDKPSLLRGMNGCNWVVSLAGIQAFWEPNRRIYEDVNVQGVRNLMECALETGVSKVVHVNTALVCSAAKLPMNPDGLGEYTRTKHAADTIAWEIHRKKRLPLVVLYLGSVIGPNDPNAVGQHIRNLMNRHVRVRAFDSVVTTYVYVGDVADAIVMALEKDHNIGEKYLLGKHQFTLKDYNELISKISGISLPRMAIPDFAALLFARIFTLLSDLAKRPLFWGISADGLKIATAGLTFDGSEAEKQLGVTYTNIATALEEAIASYKRPDAGR